MKKIDVTGKKYNRWTAICEVESGKNSKWLCQCDCGNYKIVNKMSIIYGKSKSCGCLQKELNHIRYGIPIEDVYKEIKEKEYEFIEWTNGYKNAKSNVKLRNKKGIEFITSLDVMRRDIGENNQLNDNRNSLSGIDVYDEFIKKDLIPLFKPEDYLTIVQQLPYICPNHKEKGTQYKTYDVLRNTKNKCRYCWYENYKGTIDIKIYKFLRVGAKEWRRDTIDLCNNKCVLTGNKSDDVHHLYGFESICLDVFKESNLEIYEGLNDYSNDEMMTLLKTCKLLHNQYGLGICLCKSMHQLFHSNYGIRNNTKEQFQKFIERLENHEFEEYLRYNNIKLKINYEILSKLISI